MTTGTTTQLTVDATAFMALSADDGKTACLANLGRQLDIGTTTSHIRSDGDSTEPVGRLTCKGHDVSFLLVQLGVQHLMRNLAKGEHTRKQLTDFHGCRTHKRRTSALAHLGDFGDDSVVLLALGLVDAVVHIVADDRAVGGNFHDVQLVDIPELTSLGDGCTRHARQLVIHAEVVLQRDGGKSLRSSLHFHVLLSLDSLMQAIAPTATFHDAARLFIHNLDLAIDDDVFLVEVEHRVSFQQLLNGVHALALDGVICIKLILFLHTLLVAKTCFCLKGRELSGDVRQDEQVLVVDLPG